MSEEYAVELKQRQVDYLAEMAAKHDLPDRSKALRCLVNFAMAKPEQESDIFDEIRCTDC